MVKWYKPGGEFLFLKAATWRPRGQSGEQTAAGAVLGEDWSGCGVEGLQVSWETDAKVQGRLRLDLNWGPKFQGQSRRVKIGKRVCFWVEMGQDKREGKEEWV